MRLFFLIIFIPYFMHCDGVDGHTRGERIGTIRVLDKIDSNDVLRVKARSIREPYIIVCLKYLRDIEMRVSYWLRRERSGRGSKCDFWFVRGLYGHMVGDFNDKNALSGIISNLIKYRDKQAINLLKYLELHTNAMADLFLYEQKKYGKVVELIKQDADRLGFIRSVEKSKSGEYTYRPYFYLPDTISVSNSNELLIFLDQVDEVVMVPVGISMVMVAVDLDDSGSKLVVERVKESSVRLDVIKRAEEALVLLDMPYEGYNWGLKEKIEWIRLRMEEESIGEKRKWVLDACQRLLSAVSNEDLLVDDIRNAGNDVDKSKLNR